MKLIVLLFSAAMAQDIRCYDCVDYQSDCKNWETGADMVSCPEGQCFTFQIYYTETYESYYERGCKTIDIQGEEGCINQNIDGKEASRCFKTCTKDLCNTDRNLQDATSAASTATSSILASILCYMMNHH